ncbi:uncharacterized protein LOC132719206 [Ruditapes philippinarum]|uniref:uncharacterized protein LOC132719206 n=1 Tax=Ruditapes philippinarum TaxID=129788 RepID=UPI00295B732F|nr:uncharacterized protein LOC132719206 [Ruditapes philippinarum]
MEDSKNNVALKIKCEKETTEYKIRPGRKCKKRNIEDEDSENELKRLTANSQERIRMQKINGALEDLKKCLPEQFHLNHRRMSKIRALRCAMMYIRNLSQMINDDNIRRQREYMQAMDYVRSMCDVRFITNRPEVANQPGQSQTTVIPYYPYLEPLCAEPIPSMYQTPVQSFEEKMYQPRPLDFSLQAEDKTANHRAPASDDTVEYLLAGINETPVKPKHHILPRARRYTASATPLNSKMYGSKPEPITSPLVGLRNDNELNISILSAGSDHTHDQDEIPRPPSTFSDIVAGHC